MRREERRTAGRSVWPLGWGVYLRGAGGRWDPCQRLRLGAGVGGRRRRGRGGTPFGGTPLGRPSQYYTQCVPLGYRIAVWSRCARAKPAAPRTRNTEPLSWRAHFNGVKSLRARPTMPALLSSNGCHDKAHAVRCGPAADCAPLCRRTGLRAPPAAPAFLKPMRGYAPASHERSCALIRKIDRAVRRPRQVREWDLPCGYVTVIAVTGPNRVRPPRRLVEVAAHPRNHTALRRRCCVVLASSRCGWHPGCVASPSMHEWRPTSWLATAVPVMLLCPRTCSLPLFFIPCAAASAAMEDGSRICVGRARHV